MTLDRQQVFSGTKEAAPALRMDADQLADHAVALQVVELGTLPLVGLSQDLPQCNALQHTRGDHAGTQTVVQVVGGVGQLVGDVGDLGFQVAAQLGVELAGVGDIVLRFVLDDAFAHFVG